MIRYRLIRGATRSYFFWLFFVASVIAMVCIAVAHFLIIPLCGFALGIIWACASHKNKQVRQ